LNFKLINLGLYAHLLLNNCSQIYKHLHRHGPLHVLHEIILSFLQHRVNILDEERTPLTGSPAVQGGQLYQHRASHISKYLLIRAVWFQKFYLGSGFWFFGTKKPRFGFGYFQKRITVQMYELIYVYFEHFH
jgi:hypothetical protein